jgi:hypothetical protein
MASGVAVLQLYSVSGQEFLEHIVTGDYIWVHDHTPETNCTTMGSPLFFMIKKVQEYSLLGYDAV